MRVLTTVRCPVVQFNPVQQPVMAYGNVASAAVCVQYQFETPQPVRGWEALMREVEESWWPRWQATMSVKL